MKLVQSVLTGLLVVALLVGCKAEDAVDPNAPLTPTGTVPVGSVSDSAGFAVGLVGERTVDYWIHDATDTTTYTKECKIAQGATGADADITCLIEAPELDLWFSGAKFVYNVPSTMCSYVHFSPYRFYKQEPGTGPTSVSYSIDATGLIGIDLNSNGTITGAGGETINGTVYSGGGNGLTTPTASIVAGQVKCSYACCTGDYQKTVRTWNTTTGAYGTPVVTSESWGGNYADCLAGPAMDTQPKNEDGIPLDIIYLVEGVGLNKTYTIESPEKKNFSQNLYLANYFDPADHAPDPRPAGLMLTTYTQPYYEIGCLDQTFEYVARIRLQIREWNYLSEWQSKGSGDPEVGGFEGSPFGTEPIEDILDWAIYGTAYPGKDI